MAPSGKSTFVVNPYADPVIIRVEGRADFQNSGAVSSFMETMLADNKRHFVFDFSNCTGMDSTFLGILAGTGMEVRRMKPRGQVVLCNLEGRNLETVRNLGLHRIVSVDESDREFSKEKGEAKLKNNQKALPEIEQARIALRAHENLIDIDKSNKNRFQDVISFLKNRVDQG